MTYKGLIGAIEGAALQMPQVSSIVRNDVFRLNALPDAKYGVFAWLPGEHTATMANDIVTYNFTFFYVDRLLADGGNEVDVHSDGIAVLRAVLGRLEGLGIGAASYTMQTFTQRFTDMCAGVFARVALSVPTDVGCMEGFSGLGDFNEDYNKDFYIY